MITRNQAHFVAAASPGIDRDFPTMIQLATFTIWLVFAAVGIVGAILRSKPVHSGSPAIVKQLTIDVATAAPDVPASADLAQPPPSSPPDPQPAMPPAPPTPPTVVPPAPDIAMAIPMPIAARPAAPAPPAPPQPIAPAPVRPAHAAPSVSAAPTALLGPATVRHLALGQGEGQYIKQNLEYPDEAHLAGEEGVVGIQFTQDADGHVTEAHIIKPSQWPILNQAALRAVRKTVFPPGYPSQNDVTIGFKLE
jgi:TonB family protein